MSSVKKIASLFAAVLIALTLMTMSQPYAFGFQIAIPYYLEPPPITFPVTTINLNYSRVLASNPQQDFYELFGTSEIMAIRTNFVRRDLSVSDLALDDSIAYDMSKSEHIAATAYYDARGYNHISVTTGLMRNLDLLNRADTIGRKFKAERCTADYVSYLMQATRDNIALEDSGRPLLHVMKPLDYLHLRPFVCPQLTENDVNFEENVDQWGISYDTNLNINLTFVLMHEFAHFKLGTVDQKFTKAEQRNNEIAADKFAIDFLVKNRANPLSVLPVITIYGSIDGFDAQDSDHPSAIQRTRLLVDALKEALKSDSYKKEFDQEFPNGFRRLQQLDKMLPK